jgi:hypothetical protein
MFERKWGAFGKSLNAKLHPCRRSICSAIVFGGLGIYQIFSNLISPKFNKRAKKDPHADLTGSNTGTVDANLNKLFTRQTMLSSFFTQTSAATALF